jgi:tripartite-type tricarboxylate transporter receptor subunit TctC
MEVQLQKVKTCFTLTYTQDQYDRAKAYIDDMKKHPSRVFWRGKEGRTDDELVIEQIAHRVLSGFYNDDPFNASRHIMRMDSMTLA